MYNRKICLYFTALVAASLYLMNRINDFFANPKIYNAPLFYSDINLNTLSNFIIVLLVIFILSHIFLRSNILSSISMNHKSFMIAIIVAILSFIFKAFLFDFNFDFGNRADLILTRHYYGNEFVVYKAYTTIVGLFSKLFVNFHTTLGLLNVILGSFTIGIWYLIFKKVNRSSMISIITILLVLFYIPLTAAETLIRVDVLYIFILSLSILLLLILYENYSSKNLALLTISLFCLCFIREQTIYFLPLYIGLILFKKDSMGMKVSILIPSIVVIITSLSISYYNNIHYGFSSLFKERILIQKIMQYGYLTNENISEVNTNLSRPAKKLLIDINSIYQDNILPSRREINLYANSDALKLIRPNYQTIYQKTNLMSFITDNEIEIAKKNLKSLINNSDIQLFNADTIKSIFKTNDSDDNRVTKDIKYLIINDFYYDNARYLDSFVLSDLKTTNSYCSQTLNNNSHKRMWNIAPSKELITAYDKHLYSKNCLLSVLDKINKIYLVSIRSNDYYHVAAQKIAPSFHPETQEYVYHSDFRYITEIVLKKPLLYSVQSLIVLFSQTGYVPVPSGMSNRIYQIYNNSIISKDFFAKSQELYYMIINYWYFVCFLVLIIYGFLTNNAPNRVLHLFLPIFGLYYILFIAFASYGEFPRLILPVIPILMHNFVMVTSYIYTCLVKQ